LENDGKQKRVAPSIVKIDALEIYPDRAELKREYPELEDEDIRQALAFAATLVDDKVLPIPHAR